jgi:hypothetical protein
MVADGTTPDASNSIWRSPGFLAVIGGLFVLAVVACVAITRYSAAADAASVIAAVGTVLGALVGAFFGVHVGAAAGGTANQQALDSTKSAYQDMVRTAVNVLPDSDAAKSILDSLDKPAQ